MDTYFNTSYVVIKPNLYIRLGEEIKHFNTSYVVIKHIFDGGTHNPL